MVCAVSGVNISSGAKYIKYNFYFCFGLRYSYILHTMLLNLKGTYRTPKDMCKLYSRMISTKSQRIQSHQRVR